MYANLKKQSIDDGLAGTPAFSYLYIVSPICTYASIMGTRMESEYQGDSAMVDSLPGEYGFGVLLLIIKE